MSRGRRRTREREAEQIARGLCFAEARVAHAEGGISAAELTSIYIAARVHDKAGARWLQADRRPPLPSTSTSPWVRIFAERELCAVPSAVPRALVAWAEGARPVDLLFHVPSSLEVLAVQARGRRVVSLLEDGIPTAPHEDGLAFAIHDLCHLEKFMDPVHHVEQVGFFARVERAMRDDRWRALEASLDETWIAERDHVIADMNGSAAFLYLALKNKLKLAVKRRLARTSGAPSPGEPESAITARACEEAYEMLFALLDFRGEALDAARALSRRQGSDAAAARVVSHFAEAGVEMLGAEVRGEAS